MDDHNRRFGAFYTRRRRRDASEIVPEVEIHRNNAQINIDQPPVNFLDPGGINWMQGLRSRRQRRTTFTSLSANPNIFLPSIIPPSPTNNFIDIPIEIQSPCLFDTMLEIPVEVTSVNTVLGKRTLEDILHAPLGTYSAPASTSSIGKKQRTSRLRRENFDNIIFPRTIEFTNRRARRGQSAEERRAANRVHQRNFRRRQNPEQRATLQALDTARKRALRARRIATEELHRSEPILSVVERDARSQTNATQNRTGHRGQTIDERRAANRARQRNFRINQNPEQRATLRALDAARKRAMRASGHQRDPILSIAERNARRQRNAIRQRSCRASRTMREIIVGRAISTLQHRNARHRRCQQRANDINRPLSNARLFRQSIQDIEWGWCDECNTRFPDMSSRGLCQFCKNDKKKHPEGSLFSAANMMDPGSVPLELSRLTDLESLLIARVHPMMSVYRVKGQQYKYSGNIINFVQDVNIIAPKLPYKPRDLSAILIVKRTGNNSTKEFVVRREYVRQALVWLKNNHQYYRDLTIDEGNIQELPEDGVPNDLPNIEDENDHSNNQTEPNEHNGPPEMQEENFQIDAFDSVGTIGAPIQPNQQRSIRQALQMAEADQTTANLPFTGEVINEFSREGYVAMAFPTLFPYGTADLRQPRLRKVHACQYFQHLMKYKDGRFAKDSRFRYFSLNSLNRWRALTLGDVYIRKNPQDGELSIETIRSMVSSGDTRLASRVSYYAKQIRGTRAYWYTKLKELIAMVKQLGSPTIFFTLSAADLQWPELYALLDPTNRLQTLSPIEKRREKARLLNENPLIASWFFQKRVKLFFTHFLKKEFSVVDHWYRFEWQNRGSGHVHGFLWIKDKPDVSHVATNEQVRRQLCEYFDTLVCTMNPDPTFSINAAAEHPCAKKIPVEANLDADIDDYISLVNCVMRHSRCGTYCKRKSKANGQEVCRFKFPMELLEESKIVEEPPESDMFRFYGRRNDPLINSHNRAVAQTWRANIDYSGIVTPKSVTHYIGKYATKCEPASKNFKDTLRGIVDDPQRPCLDSASAIKRLLIKNASERDISAQEVFHLLMSYHLTESSRKVVLLNLNENTLLSSQLRQRRSNDDNDTLGTDPSFVTRYMQRPQDFESMSLLQMAKKNYFARKKWSTYRIEAVVRVLPELDGKILPNTEKWEEFCRQQVLLNHPYRSIEEAKGGFQLWSERYGQLGYTLQNQPPHIDMLDDEFEDDEELFDEQLDDWMDAAAMAPYFAQPGETELGLRTHDITHNWSEGLTHYPTITEDRRFTHSLRQNEEEDSNEFETPSAHVALSQLSDQQKSAHDLVMHSMTSGSTIRLIVSGGAGTGKSTLINAIVNSTRLLFRNKKAVRVIAPTGVAAFNIGGSTIHHELAIAVDKSQSYQKLSNEQCGRMQEDFKDTKLIVIDEYSMIGRKMLANINLRCRDIFSNEEPFGNISVVLVGDMRQLQPVGDSALYVQPRVDEPPLPLLGAATYSLFKHCVILSQVFRQSGNEQSVYREALLRLSDGISTPEDWMLFNTRNYSMFTQQEKNKFKYALRLFPTKADATCYNHERLKEIGNPIARITAKNNCDAAKRARSDEAKGLPDFLLLAKGARVMLRKNLSTRYGLVNGARGIVVEVVYADGEKSPTDMPVAIMVEFDEYTGPRLYQQTNIIPIVPQTINWKSTSGVSCQRTQIPLILCWAITVHKSQGLTLDQAVVNIGTKESLGLTFVALSRTRKLQDLAFDPMFTFERIQKISKCQGLLKRRQEEERLKQFSNLTL